MSFTRAKPAGWSLFEQLTSAQMNQIDANQANALDALGGGTHATASPLEVTGSTWTFQNTRIGQSTNTAAGAGTTQEIALAGTAGNSRYWLIRQFVYDGATTRTRIYHDNTYGAQVVTWNARWDATTSQWFKDSGSSPSLKGTLGQSFASGDSRGNALAIVLAATASPFADGAWVAAVNYGHHENEAGFLYLGGSLGTGTTPDSNTLYNHAIPKAWIMMSVSSSVITHLDSFNVNVGALALNGTNEVIVTLRRAMASANYVVTPGAAFTAGEAYRFSSLATGSFNIGIASAAGAMIDLTANTRTLQCAVFGRQ
jgi:hypothetical protein